MGDTESTITKPTLGPCPDSTSHDHHQFIKISISLWKHESKVSLLISVSPLSSSSYFLALRSHNNAGIQCISRILLVSFAGGIELR